MNGQPVTGALVVFHSLEQSNGPVLRSFARTLADGTFAMSTFQPNDGVPVGRYAVTILLQDDQTGVSKVPEVYGSPDTSGLRVEIKEGANELRPFQLRHP